MVDVRIEHPQARLRQATQLLAAVLAERAPADRVMDGYFRAHRAMGVRDRGFAAETVYGCLRQLRVLEHAVGRGRATEVTGAAPSAGAAPAAAGVPDGTAAPDAAAVPAPATTPPDAEGGAAAEHLVAAYLLRDGGWEVGDLARAGYAGDAAALRRAVADLSVGVLPFAVRANLPDDLAAALVAHYGESEAQALALALNRPATLDIRTNLLKATRAQLQERLRTEGVQMEPTPLSPWGLRRADRAALFRCASFRDGWFEVQDEGSQLVAPLLQLRPHERVVDFCAGAGGKALHLGALLDNTGVVYAMDVSAGRLRELRPRLRRSGLQNVRVVPLQHERDRGLKRLAGKIDAVLVDAPCSGTGTLRRNPDLKWRRIDLDQLHVRQLSILTAAARLVRKGGRLVYATCSVLPRENQDVVAAFQREHPQFQRLAAAELLAAGGINVPDSSSAEGDLVLLPHRHGTDGFYAAALQRAERAGRGSHSLELDP